MEQPCLARTNPRTIPDPEFPGDAEELLYFVLVELNVENISELRRACKLELEGTLDEEGLKQFVEAWPLSSTWISTRSLEDAFH